MDDRIKNKGKEMDEKEKWMIFAAFLLSFLLITIIFGWSTVYWAFGISLAVANLAIFWFKREKIYILGVIVLALVTIWVYIEG